MSLRHRRCARVASIVSAFTLVNRSDNRLCACGREPRSHRSVVFSAGNGVETVVGPLLTAVTRGSRIAADCADSDASTPGFDVVAFIRVTQYAVVAPMPRPRLSRLGYHV